LETTAQSLIKNTSQVVYFNDRYYVLDGSQSILFCFGSDGKYLFKIAQQGQGPEEYLRLDYFNIDPYNNQLLLLESYGNLLVFDLDGQFISKTRLPSETPAYNEVHSIDENRLLFISASFDELLFYDQNKNTIYEHFFSEEGRVLRAGQFYVTGRVYNYNGDLFFSPQPSNEIINLSDGTVFSWNFGKRTNTKEVVEDVKIFISKSNPKIFHHTREHFHAYDWIGRNKLGNIPHWNFETFRYRFCALDTRQSFMKFIFYEKKTDQSFVFSKTKENICFLRPQFNGESLVMFYRGQKQGGNPDIDKDLVYYHPDIFTKEQRQLYESRKDDDNPFLVKYNFKQ